MNNGRYVLNAQHEAIPCADLIEWAEWMEVNDRRVARTEIGPLVVSTVFLGLDHSFGGAPPLLFETMIFGEDPGHSNVDSYCDRYSTWDKAVEGHRKAVEIATARLSSATKLLGGTPC